jgi:hypothetical protein
VKFNVDSSDKEADWIKSNSEDDPDGELGIQRSEDGTQVTTSRERAAQSRNADHRPA